MKLKAHLYPLKFKESLQLKLNDITYIFKHGWEFDLLQRKLIIELLCHNLSDGAGKIRSDFWKWITSRRDVSECIEEVTRKYASETIRASLDQKSLTMDYFQILMSPPKERLTNSRLTTEREATAKWALPFRSVEANAASSVNEGEVLVFGHTHRPLISRDGKIVNTGSWVSDEDTSYTYVEIDGKVIRLMQYDGRNSQDITSNHLRPAS